MALTKEVKDWLTINPDGVFEHRRLTQAFEDGELLGERNHRTVYTPLADKTTMPPKLRALADVVWTQKVIDDYRVLNEPRPIDDAV